jgi:hypothetical protein
MSDNTKNIEVTPAPYHPIFPGMSFEKPEGYQKKVPTFGLIIFLILIFFVIKKFIYIKDDKRDGR